MTILGFLMDTKRIPYWDRTPAISDAELDKLINSAWNSQNTYHKFPILKSNPQQYIPYEMLAPHEEQALVNHYQTLECLASRGGLSWAEALAVLQDKKWKCAIQNDNEAKPIVEKLIFEYLNGIKIDI